MLRATLVVTCLALLACSSPPSTPPTTPGTASTTPGGPPVTPGATPTAPGSPPAASDASSTPDSPPATSDAPDTPGSPPAASAVSSTPGSPPAASAAPDTQSPRQAAPAFAPIDLRDRVVTTLIASIAPRHACNRITGCPGATALAALGDALIAPAARVLTTGRPDGAWIEVLIKLLGETRDPSAAVPLLVLAQDSRWGIRIAALRALARLGPVIPDPTRATLANLATANRNAPEPPDLALESAFTWVLGATVPDAATRRAGRAELLQLMPHDITPIPLPILDQLVLIIGEARLTEALPVVRAAIATHNRFVTATAIDVARDLNDTGSIPALIVLLDHRNPTLRREALRALQVITGARYDDPAAWRAWADRAGLPR